MSHPRTRSGATRGFTLIELVATLAVVGVLIAATVVAAQRNRAAGWTAGSLSNLRELGAAYASYAAVHQDRFATFSWRAGQSNSTFPDLQTATTDAQAASNQAIDIARRRTGSGIWSFEQSWFPSPDANHLVLADFLGTSALMTMAVSPSDSVRRCLQLQLLRNEDFGVCFVPPESFPFRASRLSLYSSYVLPAAFYSPDAAARVGDTVISTISPSVLDYQQLFVPQNTPLGRRLVTDIRFPSRKVQLAERSDDTSNPRRFMLHTDASVPMLFADGAAFVRRSGLANPGINPNSGQFALIRYAPRPRDPATISGQAFDTLQGRFLWTSMGLRGVDFDGPTAPWVAP
jgi:prepilin-type N-terminal cleavage/methylation domain-containing protein